MVVVVDIVVDIVVDDLVLLLKESYSIATNGCR